MTYLHTAKPIRVEDDGRLIELMNGRAHQLGMDRWNWTMQPGANAIAEQVIDFDIGGCLDAPRDIPAGGCYGLDLGAMAPGFAAPMQHTIRR